MFQPSHVVVFDFDGTFTPKEYVSLFNVIDKTLSEKSQKEIQQIREKYLPKALAGELTPEEMLDWVTTAIRIYIESGLTISKTREAVSTVNLRPGVITTLRFLHSSGIPVAIISYGIAQFIEAVLEKKVIKEDIPQIYAANLLIENELVCGYQPETFVCSENKGDFSRLFAEKHDVAFENILAVGDSAVDYRLGHLP